MNTNNTVKKALSFVKGLTNTPSDFLSSDDELTESVGIIMKNGEMAPIQKPICLHTFNQDEILMYVHKGAEYNNFVTFNEKTKEIGFYFGDDGNVQITGEQKFTIETNVVKSVTSVNNICVVTTNDKRLYFLLKEKKYIMFGELPDLHMTFSLTQDGDTLDLLSKKSDAADFTGLTKASPLYYAVYSLNSDKGFWEFKEIYQNGHGSPGTNDRTTKYIYLVFNDDNIDDIQDVCAGNTAKILKLTKEKQRFLYPFFVRYAYRLFDGTYARISNPIAIYPSVTRNGYLTPVCWDTTNHKFVFDNINNTFLYSLNALKYQLNYTIFNDTDWKIWSDIIKEVVVFASDDVTPFKTDTKYDYISDPTESMGTLVSDCIEGSDNPLFQKSINTIEWRHTGNSSNAKLYARPIFIPSEYKTDNEIMDEMLAKTLFYKLFSIDVDKMQKNVLLPAPIKAGVLENLETQEQLPHDDYFGWTKMINDKSYSYNKRINLTGVKRYPFSGFDFFTSGNRVQYGEIFHYYTHVVSETMDAWVKMESSYSSIYTTDSWFYYPDPNAKELIIFRPKTSEAQKIQLKRHPTLNGAYAFNHLPNKINFSPGDSDDPFGDQKIELPNVNSEAYEELNSQIFTSVVNNPFVFQADGDNTVGTGSILNIVANTEPISQGQFGQYPLIVFTTDGIYALSVNSEGLYAASYPVSREVCNNANSITPTDRLVFFTSEKGLMAISGGAVQCVSTQLSGPTPNAFKVIGDGDFRKFLANCRIAYDYRESLLRIYSPNYIYHYVYNITDQTFAKAENEGNALLAVASSYPDNLVQEVDGKVYSMLAKPDINADQRTYSGTFITRPLKLGSSLELKTIRQILHFFNSSKGTMKLRIFGSNDCRTWRELKSIHGKPWLFYTLQYDLSNLRASDSFAGTVLAIETRFNDKMR